MEREKQKQRDNKGSPGRYNHYTENYSVKDLIQRFDELETYITTYIEDSAQRLADVESGIKELNAIADERGKNINFTQETVKTLQQHFDRMEKGLLSEFKISQEIMRALLEHDMNIERAKFELKNEMERREQEMRQEQQREEAARLKAMEERAEKEEQARADFKRDIYRRFITIFAPALVAATAAVVTLIERLVP